MQRATCRAGGLLNIGARNLSYGHSISLLASYRTATQKSYYHATTKSPVFSFLEVPDVGYATQPNHINHISQSLASFGVVKLRLGFPDKDSKYLTQLLLSLQRHHGHNLPISHSATRGWFWDVRPSKDNFQAGAHQARSETMNEFPWHTDCSYEEPPPRYFALQVLQHDRYGGGTLSILSVEKLTDLLSPETRTALMASEYQITIPPEFIKDPNKEHIIGNVLDTDDSQSTIIRYREDILTPLTERAARALEELKSTLQREEVQKHAIVHVHAHDLPKGSIILVDNRRWLHARNHIKDPERHLRRVRWDACPFGKQDEP